MAEASAVSAASFYAQASGRPTVANVHVAPGLGNAIGSIVGGAMLTTFSMNYRYTGLGGMPLALLAVGLLAFYSWRCETDTDAIHRLRETKVD